MTEENVLEELKNIVRNQPVFSGDTISHQTASECEKRGWARRNKEGDWLATPAGKKKFYEICKQ